MDMESLRFSIQKGIEMENNAVNVIDENHIEVGTNRIIAVDSGDCIGCYFYKKGDGVPCKFYDIGHVSCLAPYREDERSIIWVPASYNLKYC